MKVVLKMFGLVAFCFLFGCGYTFQGSGSVLPPDVKKVYVPFVENNSTEAGLSALLTESLRDRFERFGIVETVDSIEEADAVLTVRVISVKRDTDAVRSHTDTAVALNDTMTLSAELKRLSGLILWKDGSIRVSRSYAAVGSVVVTSSADFASSGLAGGDLLALGQSGSREVARSQEQGALGFLADKAAQYIYDAAVAPDF